MKLVSTKPLLINVVGKPAPQGSKVSTRFGMREASQFVAPWRNQVVSACIEQRINEGEVITEPVKVDMENAWLVEPEYVYNRGDDTRSRYIYFLTNQLFNIRHPITRLQATGNNHEDFSPTLPSAQAKELAKQLGLTNQ